MTGFLFQETYLLYFLAYTLGLATGAGLSLWIGYALNRYFDREDGR